MLPSPQLVDHVQRLEDWIDIFRAAANEQRIIELSETEVARISFDLSLIAGLIRDNTRSKPCDMQMLGAHTPRTSIAPPANTRTRTPACA